MPKYYERHTAQPDADGICSVCNLKESALHNTNADAVILVVEFTGAPDARAKSNARILTVSTTLDGRVRCHIQAELTGTNCEFFTISDETMTTAIYEYYVKPSIPVMPNCTVRKGTI